MTSFLDSAELLAEVERYLAAVAVFRTAGHEPRWLPESLEGACRGPSGSLLPAEPQP